MRSYRKILQLFLGAVLLLSPSMTRAQSGTSSAAVSQVSLKNVLSCIDTSVSANTITCTSTQPIGAYSTSQFFLVTIKNANTGATTININGLGAVAVNKNATQALVSGDVAANGTYWMYYTGSVFDIVGITGGTSTGSMTWPAAAGIAVYAGGNAWGTSLTAPTGAIVGTTDIQTLTNKTLDGVTPATMAFVDPTSSIQTQLNTKAPSASPTLTGTDTGTETLTNKTVDGVTPTTFGFVDPTSSIQTQLNAKAPLASPTFTGTVTTAASAAGGAGLNLPHGVAPTTPNNGDLWTTTLGLFAQINGATIGPFGTGAGGGNLSNSGTPVQFQYGVFVDATHLGGVSPGAAGLPLVSNGLFANPSAQALPIASIVAGASNGDLIQMVSGAWADVTPGISINSITGVTYTVAAADRGDRDQFTGTAASAWTLPKAGSAGFGNNFFFTVPNFSANNVGVTITPTTSNCNGGLSCIVGQGQIAYLTSDPTANAGNGSYYANIGWNTLSSGSLVTITPNQFGGTVDLTGVVPQSLGGCGQTTQTACFNALAPTPTRAGDFTYYNGTNYVNLAGNNSGTNCLQENASGVPSFAACGGGSTTLDTVGDPAANKAFSMGVHSLAFNWGTNAFNLDTAGATPTFGLLSYTTAITNSPTLTLAGSYENAATPTFAEDSWGLQNIIGAGLNGTSTLTLTHSGTTGGLGLSLPASLTVTANTLTVNSTTGGISVNGPGSSGITINSSGGINLSSGTGQAVGITPASGNNLNITMLGTGQVKLVGSSGATDQPFLVKYGLAAPTADIAQFQSSAAAVLVSIGPSGVVHDSGTQIVSAADYTNSTTTPSTVFSWTLPPTGSAKTYRYSCDITWESTNTTLVGPVLGLNISAAPTQLTGTGYVTSSLTGSAQAEGYLSNATTGSQTLVTGLAAAVTSTNYYAKIWGTIEGAPTAGSTFLINAASTNGTTATLNIRRGSSCVMTSTN